VLGALVVVLLVVTGALAVHGLALTLLDRQPGRGTRVGVTTVVAMVGFQAAVAVARMVGGVRLAQASTFLIYLVVAMCMLPMAQQWAAAEPSRWGGAVVAVAAVATGVAVLRLHHLWVPVG